ncbi:transporter suffix domain-containing protein [Microvirga massiliensis]|uniref:transporter suffix domain-containing protein n=1 Tax=Microvirga massiliensis TaxID=1033741 RepID=UPI00062B945B|nr:transporter suffix domain-containing protein [Microvirga massiliensis]
MTASVQESGTSPSADGRFKTGIWIFVLAFALWLLIPLAALFKAAPARIAAMTGVIFAANKALLLVCVAVMGRAGFQRLKAMVSGYVKGLSPADTVGPTRYAIGLVMFCLPLVSGLLVPYVDRLWPGLRPDIWPLQVLGDIMLLASFFVLGGDFWNKVRALFSRTAKVVETESMAPVETCSG